MNKVVSKFDENTFTRKKYIFSLLLPCENAVRLVLQINMTALNKERRNVVKYTRKI